MIVRTKEINLMIVVVENFRIRGDRYRGPTKRATVEKESIIGTAVKRMTERESITIDTAQEEKETTTEKTPLVIRSEILGGKDLGLIVVNADTIVITKSKLKISRITRFLGDKTQANRIEKGGTTRAVVDAVTRGIVSTQGGIENNQMSILTLKRQSKLKLFLMLMNMETNFFGMVSSGLVKYNDL